ncbi:MAG: aminoglycoside phosphotransferase (APT) family kinase protein [Parvicella sp.]
MTRSQELLLQGHETLLHGDTHVGNTYVLPGEKGGLLDFQLLVKGNPLIDVSYYIIAALDTDSRSKHQHELLQYYLDQLKELGIAAMTFDSAWQDYRLSSLWGLVIGWLITPPVNYGEDITNANIERTAKAVVDLDVYSLLETA